VYKLKKTYSVADRISSAEYEVVRDEMIKCGATTQEMNLLHE
jgi:hypothetical protein